jgi:hypothetical protein
VSILSPCSSILLEISHKIQFCSKEMYWRRGQGQPWNGPIIFWLLFKREAVEMGFVTNSLLFHLLVGERSFLCFNNPQSVSTALKRLISFRPRKCPHWKEGLIIFYFTVEFYGGCTWDTLNGWSESPKQHVCPISMTKCPRLSSVHTFLHIQPNGQQDSLSCFKRPSQILIDSVRKQRPPVGCRGSEA